MLFVDKEGKENSIPIKKSIEENKKDLEKYNINEELLEIFLSKLQKKLSYENYSQIQLSVNKF